MSFFFFNDTATTEIYTLSLHDALPIYEPHRQVDTERLLAFEAHVEEVDRLGAEIPNERGVVGQDRKSTRLNSSHGYISYAVFCLKKKQKESALTVFIPSLTAHGLSCSL